MDYKSTSSIQVSEADKGGRGLKCLKMTVMASDWWWWRI